MRTKRWDVLKDRMPIPRAEEKFHLTMCPPGSRFTRKFLPGLYNSLDTLEEDKSKFPSVSIILRCLYYIDCNGYILFRSSC